MFKFLTDECVSDHNGRIRSIQIDKNFFTQTFRKYNFIISRTVRNLTVLLMNLTVLLFVTVLLMMKLYIRNVWVKEIWSICINLILSLWSETHSSVKNSNIILVSYLRQDPPPLDLSFWSFLTFLHHGIEEVERHLLWKFYKKIRRKRWSNVPPKLLACIGFLYKVVHKIGRLRNFNCSRGI